MSDHFVPPSTASVVIVDELAPGRGRLRDALAPVAPTGAGEDVLEVSDDGLEPHPQVVGIPEIADRLGVERATVDQWKWRGVLPDPRWSIGGRPAWRWSDVERWARATGRLPS